MKITLNVFKKNCIIKKIEEWITIFFLCAGMFVLIFLTQALLLTWLNQFKTVYILISLFISFLLTIIFLRFIKNDTKLIPHLNIAVLSVIFLVSLILIFFPHDCFGGRDEGMYSGLAIILSKYHSISIPSYLIKTPLLYGSPEQTFSLTTPTYVVWLAAQKVLFGIEWMLRSNVVLVFLGLCSLFLVSSLITKKSLGFITVLLFSTCMPFLWFSRETMTENMAFFLLWFLILSLFLFIKTKRGYFLASLFLSSWLLSFTRTEGFFIQFLILATITIFFLIKKWVSIKKTCIITLIYISLIILSFITNNHFSNFSQNSQMSGVINDLKTNISFIRSAQSTVLLINRVSIFTISMLAKQNLILIVLSIFLTIPLIFISKNNHIKNKTFYMIILIILSPEFIKIVNPSASLEQPWLYRRYLYALLPLGYLAFSIFIKNLPSRYFSNLLFIFFFILNISLSINTIFLKNNWSITGAIEKLTLGISTKDFVIIDGKILKNYYPMNYLAYHKEVRNLYNYWLVNDKWSLEEKKYLDIPYEKLYLLTDKNIQEYSNFKIKKVRSQKITSWQLIPNCELWALNHELKLKGVLWIPYEDALEYCKKIDNEIAEIDENIFLYELTYKE